MQKLTLIATLALLLGACASTNDSGNMMKENHMEMNKSKMEMSDSMEMDAMKKKEMKKDKMMMSDDNM